MLVHLSLKCRLHSNRILLYFERITSKGLNFLECLGYTVFVEKKVLSVVFVM